MRKEDFEALILDYLEGKLSPVDAQAFESAQRTSPELSAIFYWYNAISSSSSLIGKEEYRASPGFKYRVMDAIEQYAESSIAQRVTDLIFGGKTSFQYGTGIAVLLIATLLWTQPEFRQLAVKNIGQIVGSKEDPNQDIENTPIIIRSSTPFMIAQFTSGGERLDITPGAESQRESAIEQLFNAIGKPFPAGNQIPLGVSIEAVKSPKDPSNIFFRVTLTGNGFEQEYGPVAKDLKVYLLFDGKVVQTIEPLGNKKEVIEKPDGKLLWATGQQMVVEQQFTSLATLTLQDEHISADSKVLEIAVQFIDNSTLEKNIVRVPLYVKDIQQEFKQASPSMQQAFWWLFSDMMNPGLSNIDPKAFGEFHGQIEGLVRKGLPAFMDPNPESLKQFEEALKGIKVPNLNKKNTKLRLPESVMKRFPRSTLRKMYGERFVDPEGNPL